MEIKSTWSLRIWAKLKEKFGNKRFNSEDFYKVFPNYNRGIKNEAVAELKKMGLIKTYVDKKNKRKRLYKCVNKKRFKKIVKRKIKELNKRIEQYQNKITNLKRRVRELEKLYSI